MITINCKKAFTACARRLAKSLTLKTALNIVRFHLPKQDADNTMNTLTAHFSDDQLAQGAPLRLANDLLSHGLTGEDYNITSQRLKSIKSEAPNTLLEQSHLFSLYAHSETHYQGTRDALFKKYHALFKAQALNGTYTIVSPNGKSAALWFAQLFPWFDAQTHFSQSGFELPVSNHHGLAQYNTVTEIRFSNGHTLRLVYDFKSSEYEGVDEQFLTLFLDGEDVEDNLIVEDNPDAWCVIDTLTEAFLPLLVDTGCYREADIECPAQAKFDSCRVMANAI
jgi:hypothetical protein